MELGDGQLYYTINFMKNEKSASYQYDFCREIALCLFLNVRFFENSFQTSREATEASFCCMKTPQNSFSQELPKLFD